MAKAMARRPDDRFATVGELRTALAAVLAGTGPASFAPPVDSTTLEPAPDATPPGGIPAFVESERSWLLPALLVMLVAVALGVAAVLLGDTIGNELLNRGDSGGTASAAPLPPSSATAFDPPPGDGSENDDEAIEAIDGDPATAWTTEGYNSREFGNLKPGVGLIVELDDSHTIDSVVLDSPTTGWSVEIYVSAEVGQTLADWGPPVGGGEGLDVDPEFPLDGIEGRVVLVWITDLGDAVSDEFVRATIAEIVVTGT